MNGHLTYDFKLQNDRLELNHIDEWATYFSIAPKRSGGFISAKSLSKKINHEIIKRYPTGINAGLTMFEKNKKTATLFI